KTSALAHRDDNVILLQAFKQIRIWNMLGEESDIGRITKLIPICTMLSDRLIVIQYTDIHLSRKRVQVVVNRRLMTSFLLEFRCDQFRCTDRILLHAQLQTSLAQNSKSCQFQGVRT